MAAIKGGDIVRVIEEETSCGELKLGETYKVTGVDDYGYLSIFGKLGVWSPCQFKIVTVTNTPRDGDSLQDLYDRADRARARGSDLQPQTPQAVREFGTGATRDLDANKLDFEGFLSPLVLERYAEHMHKARRMPDGSMRESDNWQLGIPVPVYMKSLFRHFFSVWKLHRGLPVTEVVKGETITKDLETELCATLFNASGMLHEVLKAKKK